MLARLRAFLWNNGLSAFMFGLFFIFLFGLSVTGLAHNNELLAEHSQPPQSYAGYVFSGEFVEAVFENWESEFLQMAALVIATIFLRQRGSADSKRLRGRDQVDATPRYSVLHASSWRLRVKAVQQTLYANSLSLALLALFALSFVLHAVGGQAARNEEALQHGQPEVSLLAYIASSQFWFESFQNWQSEFLAVGTLLVLSIFLRQRGSPESKPIGEPNQKTGG